MCPVVCHHGFGRSLTCIVVLCLVSFGYPSFAQEDGTNKAQRERELRDQLQNILNELDQLQKPESGAPVEDTPPSAIVDGRRGGRSGAGV